MSNFVTRIEAALEEVRSAGPMYPRVDSRDLAELLRHFKSMDARERMHYPVHVEMLVEAAVEVVRAAPERFVDSTQVKALCRALDYSKPGWRNT